MEYHMLRMWVYLEKTDCSNIYHHLIGLCKYHYGYEFTSRKFLWGYTFRIPGNLLAKV
jgi:hypothetical protein